VQGKVDLLVEKNEVRLVGRREGDRCVRQPRRTRHQLVEVLSTRTLYSTVLPAQDTVRAQCQLGAGEANQPVGGPFHFYAQLRNSCT